MAHLTKPPGLPARRAEPVRSPSSSELMELDSQLEPAGGSIRNMPGPYATSQTYQRVDSTQDQRSVNYSQQVLNQVDARQIHVQVDPQMPGLVLEAANAVAEANQRTATIENQALRAVLEAKGETSKVQAQAEVLVARFATELQASATREDALRSQVGALQDACQDAKSELGNARREIQALKEELAALKSQSVDALNGAAGLPNVLDEWKTRIQQLEQQLQGNMKEAQAHWETEHHALRTMVEELWWEVRSWNDTSPSPLAAGNAEVSTPTFHRMASSDDEGPGQGSRSSAPSIGAEDLELLHVKQKDLHYLKFPSLPDNAGAYRQWRNSVVPMLSSYDRSSDGALHEWYMKAFKARSETDIADLAVSSGAYPRFDRVLASALTKPEHLKSHFGIKLQAYLEDAEALGRPLRGRVLLNLIAREFDTDATYGAVVSELELFSLPPPEGSVASLKAWRDKARYILGQLPASERPAEKLMSKWLFEKLKKVPSLRRHTDKVRDSPEGSVERGFEWLWSRLDRTILENQQEQNLQSIQQSLKKGPPGVLLSGAPAPTAEQKQKEAAAAAAKAKAAAAKANPPKPEPKDGKGKTPKGKGKGKDGGKKGDGKPSDPLFAKAKEQGVCVFYQKGLCRRDPCPFKHEMIAGAAAPEAKAKSSPTPKATGATSTAKAAVALVMALASGVAGQPVGTHGSHVTLDIIGDTGAGEHLGSRHAFLEQGVDDSILESSVGTSVKPMAFDTGGGKKSTSETLGLWSKALNTLSNMYMLKSCPLVYSIGQFVMHQGFGFHWESGQLPFLVPPEVPCHVEVDRDKCKVAHRVDHCVPVFQETVEIVSGMPVPVRSEDAIEPPDDIRQVSVNMGWGDLGEAKVLVQQGPKTFSKGIHENLDLRTTWLVNATEWFLLEERVEWAKQDEPERELPHVAHTLVTLFESSRLPARRADPEDPAVQPEPDDTWVDEIEPNHFLTHLPKSRKCNICLQSKLIATPHRRLKHQSQNLREARQAELPEGPLQRIEVDHVISYDQPSSDEEVVSLVCRDRYSGTVWSYPALTKEAEEVEDALRHFCGNKAPIISVASDRAPEILKAIRDVGFTPDPSVPGDTLHNPFAESAIRTLKQGTATLLLQSGLSTQHWKWAQRCFAFMCNATMQPPKEIRDCASEAGREVPDTRYETHLGYPYEGYLVPFGALVWFRDKTHATYEPRGKPALYLGPEVIAGMKFKGAHVVVSLRSIKDGDFVTTVTKDLAIPNGKWSFPMAQAKIKDEDNPHHALPDVGSFTPPAEEELPEPVEVPPPIVEGPNVEEEVPRVPRNRAITRLRIAVHGKSPKCFGCRYGSYNHTVECRKRFNDLLDFHEPLPDPTKTERDEEDAYVPPEESEVPAFTPPPAPGERTEESAHGLMACAEILTDPDIVQEIPMTDDQVQTRFEELPQCVTFGLPAKEKRAKVLNSSGSIFIEFCCSANSQIRRVADSLGIEYVGLSKDFVDLEQDDQFQQVLSWAQDQAENHNKVLHVWGSLPCTAWCAWQNMNVFKNPPEFQEALLSRREASLKLVDKFALLSETALESGGSSSFEWPKNSDGWLEPKVLQMVVGFNMQLAYPTGCGFKLCIDGKFPLKSWRVATTHERVAVELNRRKCRHSPGHKHDVLQGDLAWKSGFYNRAMATTILGAIFPDCFQKHVPCMPVVECEPESSEHVPRDVPPTASFTSTAGLVTKALTRKEMLADEKALEAVKAEGQKVRNRQVWDDSTVTERESLCKNAEARGEKIHVAEAMTIAGIKNHEMHPRHHVHKGRVVYRGDAVKDEGGLPAMFRELHSLPTNIQAVNLTLFVGMIAGFVVQTADACQAFLQAPLSSTIPTWVVLPRELWLPSWEGRFKRPAVRLLRALYGHPEAPAEWHSFFEKIMLTCLAAQLVDGFPSVYWIASLAVLVTVYVDDILAAGAPDKLATFWQRLREHVDVEDVLPVDRFLGRYHWFSRDLSTIHMHMEAYAHQAIELYQSLPGSKPLKPVNTPYLAEGSLPMEDYQVKGTLSDTSARILMKLLWFSRLCRPDLAYAISTLAVQTTCWSRNADKQVHRLMCYVQSTASFGLKGVVKDKLQDCWLDLFCDADLGGCVHTAKSTSGLWLQVAGPNGTQFPIAWSSRRQQAVSRSTTEAELVSLAEGLFTEALPVQDLLSRICGQSIPIRVREDNESVIKVLNAGYSVKLRGLVRTQKLSIASVSHHLKEHPDEISLNYTSTKDQLADLLTKVLGRLPFEELLRKLGLCKVPEN